MRFPRPPSAAGLLGGARLLRGFVAREVETRIARALVAGEVQDGAVIRVGVTDGEITVTHENPS